MCFTLIFIMLIIKALSASLVCFLSDYKSFWVCTFHILNLRSSSSRTGKFTFSFIGTTASRTLNLTILLLLCLIHRLVTFPSCTQGTPGELFLTPHGSQNPGIKKQTQKEVQPWQMHLDHPDVTEISTRAAVTTPAWAVFSATSSEVISAIKNGYSHEVYYFVISCRNSAECHHTSVQAHLQTQAHSLLIQARQYEEVSLYKSATPSLLPFFYNSGSHKVSPILFLC